MKATDQYFPLVLFYMLVLVVTTFESVEENLNWDHSNESSLGILSIVAIHWVGLTCESVCEIL